MLLTTQELNHIVSNLIQNAIEAVRDSGMGKRMIEVHVSVAQCICEFSIRDSGLGFSDDVLNQLRSGEVVTTKINGNGVGTKVARNLLTDVGGTIQFGNSRNGGAETFVQIPVSG